MRKALQSLLNTHFSSTTNTTAPQPSKEILDIVIDSSNGDIRSAIMALQFACIADAGGTSSTKQKNGRKKTAKGGSSKLQAGVVMEAVTRREQSLALFHLLGKVLYNKRMLFSLFSSFYRIFISFCFFCFLLFFSGRQGRRTELVHIRQRCPERKRGRRPAA